MLEKIFLLMRIIYWLFIYALVIFSLTGMIYVVINLIIKM